MTILKSEQEWTMAAQLGQLKTGQDGKGLLQSHLWCTDELPRLWDRIENRKIAEEHVVFNLFIGAWVSFCVSRILPSP